MRTAVKNFLISSQTGFQAKNANIRGNFGRGDCMQRAAQTTQFRGCTVVSGVVVVVVVVVVIDVCNRSQMRTSK